MVLSFLVKCTHLSRAVLRTTNAHADRLDGTSLNEAGTPTEFAELWAKETQTGATAGSDSRIREQFLSSPRDCPASCEYCARRHPRHCSRHRICVPKRRATGTPG